YVTDFEGRISEANDAFLRILGYDREDLIYGRLRWTELTPPEWRERDERAMAELRSTGSFQPFEKENFRKDGSRVPVLVGVALFKEGGEEGVAFVLDLTERKRAQRVEESLRALQAEVARVARLTTMGQLAASIAHEISQPLTAILGSAETCVIWLAKDEPDLPEARKAA